MTINWQHLDNRPRLLMEAGLKPIQGTRLQPTGFPDLGAAAYQAPGANGQSTDVVLVESAQSMANRLEAICWNEGTGSLYEALTGMPYVSVTLWDSGDSTNSILEAHRLNSPYIMRDSDFPDEFRGRRDCPRGTRQRVCSTGGDWLARHSGMIPGRSCTGCSSRTSPEPPVCSDASRDS